MKIFNIEFSAQTLTDHHVLANVGSKTTYTGAGTTVGSWFMSSEAGILFGIVIGVCGLAMNWYYSRKKDKREQAEHELRMAELRAEIANAGK